VYEWNAYSESDWDNWWPALQVMEQQQQLYQLPGRLLEPRPPTE